MSDKCLERGRCMYLDASPGTTTATPFGGQRCTSLDPHYTAIVCFLELFFGKNVQFFIAQKYNCNTNVQFRLKNHSIKFSHQNVFDSFSCQSMISGQGEHPGERAWEKRLEKKSACPTKGQRRGVQILQSLEIKWSKHRSLGLPSARSSQTR